MTTNLYDLQIALEEEAQGDTIRRFHKEHKKASQGGSFTETLIGKNLLVNYLNLFADAVEVYTSDALAGKAGRNNRTAKHINRLEPATVSFLTIKSIINTLGLYEGSTPRGQGVTTVTAMAIRIGVLLHDELKCRALNAQAPALSRKIHDDFNKRELLRYKRIEHLNGAMKKLDLEWSQWSQSEMCQVGMVLIGLFKDLTGDIKITHVNKNTRRQKKIIEPSEALVRCIKEHSEMCEALLSNYMPMVVPPVPWGAETLRMGGYVTGKVHPYPLVKRKSLAYYEELAIRAERGDLDNVFKAINAIQETAWKVNEQVRETLEWAWGNNLVVGKMPASDNVDPPETPQEILDLPKEDPRRRDAMQKRAIVHEANRRAIGGRTMVARVLQLAKKYSQYDAFYFPHDMDSRGRLYSRPVGLNPQGPDYAKALLCFAEGKPLGASGTYWLAVHGANCWGADKLPLDERYDWAFSDLERARSVAADPRTNLEWLKADNPAQYLAWCFEWAAAINSGTPETYVSHLHVDLDATCSGLQHFAAMLRDEIGGRHVNMVPSETREDVYQAVADAALDGIRGDLGGDRDSLARAWIDFGMDRKITKRSVMVKPYSGTRSSCADYVAEEVDRRIRDGHPLPWPENDLATFKSYGVEHVWNSIPTVVVAADGAMRWLMDVTKLVAKSKPADNQIKWTSPIGMPVHLTKMHMKARQIQTYLDGSVFRPNILYETDKLDGRKLASSVAPSFVHALDAAHLVETMAQASDQGITSFAVVHDSFGVHACDVAKFSYTIRAAFIRLYENHNVLEEFLAEVKPLISSELLDDIPPIPAMGKLNIYGVLSNQYFFS